MLDIKDITVRFGTRVLFDNASAFISDGQKVGLVGANGCGKTTLFRIITGDFTADEGTAAFSKNERVATVAQDAPATDEPLIDCILKADTERTRLLEELEKAQLAQDGVLIGEIHERLNAIDAASANARAAEILYGLGFDEEAQNRPVSSFSGGWRMRAALAATLFVPSDTLLLDEPTNHLDLEASMWLDNYLQRYRGTLFIISHDRAVLNRLCTRILHIENGKIQSYGGNYDAFEHTIAVQREAAEKSAMKAEERRKHLQSYVDRFRYKASKAKQAQSRLKMLERMETVELLPKAQSVKFNFPSPSELASPLLKIEDGVAGYGDKVVLKKLNLRIDADDRIALLGANGNGKSTLAKILSGRLALMSGEKTASSKLLVGYYAQHQTEELNPDLTAFEQMRVYMKDALETKIRAHLGAFGISQQKADTKISALSGGEKTKLLFAVMSRNAPHVLILDEPTNHLDMDAREALSDALNAYKGAVILITHDLRLIEMTADRLWLVANGQCKSFDGDLDDYRELLLKSKKDRAALSCAKKDAAPAVSRKDERREAAAKRQQSAPLRKELQSVEKQMEKTAKEIETAQNALQDPALYERADSAAMSAGLQKQIKAAQDKMQELESRWLELSEELEAAQ